MLKIQFPDHIFSSESVCAEVLLVKLQAQTIRKIHIKADYIRILFSIE